MPRARRTGFTLIEVAIVIGVISILSLVSIVGQGYHQSARLQQAAMGVLSTRDALYNLVALRKIKPDSGGTPKCESTALSALQQKGYLPAGKSVVLSEGFEISQIELCPNTAFTTLGMRIVLGPSSDHPAAPLPPHGAVDLWTFFENELLVQPGDRPPAIYCQTRPTEDTTSFSLCFPFI
ncbi:MAG: prepilin-type N-terminal cleavage/methylation domain-containing protein [Myxococcota bacterium]|nr:prepilin-type N-terminal cleavage/methylation domain-containing protein [Myxococcota bacterium]